MDLMNDRLLASISLCRKAGKLRMGSDVVKDEVIAKNAVLVLLAGDLAPRSERQIRFVCERERCKVVSLPFQMEQLAQVTGRLAGILAVCDPGFAKMIEGLLPSSNQ